MKVLITTLNSKYIHTALSVRYLKRYYEANKGSLKSVLDMKEFTINNQLDQIVEEIALSDYDVIAFSCYIWNIEQTLKIVNTLKKIQPELKIILGGPEVTHETETLFEINTDIDFVLVGEGEESFLRLLEALELNQSFENVNGLFYLTEFGVQQTPFNPSANDVITEQLPFAYESFEGLDHKILYYESSRGCPYNCKYCLSSTIKGVRYFPIEKVQRDLMTFIDAKVMQVKFVDRTFNADRKRALDIMTFIHENDNGYTNFHFEITASMLDEATLVFLETVRPELFQFEVGVQSTNEKTLKEIDRNIPFDKIKETCSRIKSYQNIHLHLDLIAGLPFEGFDSFMKSMDDLFTIGPEKIQLGFLKLLKGAQLRVNAEQYGMIYRAYPPYEILETKWLSYKELSKLKHMEDLLDHYYNSGKFQYAMAYLVKKSDKSFSKVLEEMYEQWQSNNWFENKHSLMELYKRLFAYGETIDGIDDKLFKELLRFDYLRYNRKKGDAFFEVSTPTNFKNQCHAFLQDTNNVEQYLPRFIGTTAKTIIKQVHFETFSYNIIQLIQSDYEMLQEQDTVILFDYKNKNKIFENYDFYEVVLED